MSELTKISPSFIAASQPVPDEVIPAQEITKDPFQNSSLQFKLSVGSADDPLEDEADSMADTVMRMPESNLIQRKCSHCEDDEKVHRKPLASFIQRKESSASETIPESVSDRIHASQSGGSMINGTALDFMESRFGTDFGDVKIHTDSDAIQLNQELNARAFTVGSHVYFNEGQYNTNSDDGKKLLAHELTHTIQQANGLKRIQRSPQSIADRPEMKKNFGAFPDWKIVLQKHRAANPGDIGVKELADKIEKMFENPMVYPSMYVQQLQIWADKTNNGSELDVLFDTFKWLNAVVTAKECAKSKKYFPQRTAFYSADFYKHVLKDDLNWLKEVKTLDKFFPYRYVESYRIYLFGPFNPRQDIVKISELKKTYSDLLSEISKSKGLLVNERELIALEAFLLLDKFRYQHLAELEKSYKPTLLSGRKEVIAEALLSIDWPSMGEQNGLEEEAIQLLKDAEPKQKVLFKQAINFWNTAQSDLGSFNSKDLASQLTEEMLRSVVNDHKKEFLEYEKPFLALSLAALKLTNEGTFPDLKIYQKQQGKAAEMLKKLSYKASAKVIGLYYNPPKDHKTLSRAYGLLLLGIRILNNHLISQSKSDPSAQAATEDTLITHRLLTGKLLSGLGNFFGLETLESMGNEVNKPSGKALFGPKAQAESFIAFTDNLQWEMEKLLPNDAVKKFDDETGKIADASTLVRLAKYFFLSAKMKDEKQFLEFYLSTKGKEIEGVDMASYKPIQKMAQKDLEEKSISEHSSLPRRFVLKGVSFSVVPKDKEVFGSMIQKDERFKDAFRNRFAKHDVNLISLSSHYHYAAGGIVVWVMANLAQMAEYLKLLFPQLVSSKLDPDDPVPWIKDVAARLKQFEDPLGKDQTDPYLEGLKQKANEKLSEQARDELEPLRRRAFSHHRRVINHHVIKPLWDAFDDTHSTSSNPKEAINHMIEMSGPVLLLDDKGKDEIKLQIAATMLELVPLIGSRMLEQESLGGLLDHHTRRTDIIGILIAHVRGALSLEQKVKTLSPSLNLEYSIDEHQGRVKKLEQLYTGLRKTLRDRYAGQWLSSSISKEELVESDSNYPLSKKKPLLFEGKIYSLQAVHKDFYFQPAVEIDTGYVNWSEDMVKDINPTYLFLKEGGRLKSIPWRERKGMPLFTLDIVDMNTGDAKTEVITDLHSTRIHEIKSLIAYRSNMENLKTLGEVLETGAEWLLTPVYFIPGIGQAVMAGEFVVGILQFLASGDFQTIKRILSGDGKIILMDSYNKISHLLEPNELWEMLLDDDVFIAQTGKVKDGQTSEVQNEIGKKEGKLKKLIKRLQRFGKKVLKGVGKLKNLINFSIKKARQFVLRSPALSAALSYISDNFFLLAAKIPSGVLDEKPDKTEAGDLRGEAQNVVGTLNHLQVPRDIIPTDAIIDMILSLAIRFIAKGPKKLLVKGIREVLVKLGLWDKITGYIAKALGNTYLDPNKPLNEFIDQQVQPLISKAGTEMATDMQEVLQKIPGFETQPPLVAPANVKLEDSDEDWSEEDADEDELQPFVSDEQELTGLSPQVSKGSSGKPLDEGLSNEMSERYGHDFSHVRIHKNSEADEALETAGAEALTSGSHIYMKSDLSTQDDTGQSILRHELAHVLQQTGPRLLNEKHADNPIDGRSGKGIVFDQRKEDEADQFAKNGWGNLPASPSHSNTGDAEGYIPKLTNQVLRFFKSIAKPGELDPKKHILTASSGAKLTQAEKTLAGNLHRQLKQVINSSLSFGKKKKFIAGEADIKQNLMSKDWTSWATFFEDYIRYSKVEKKTGRGSSATYEWQLNVERLETALEDFISIQTGMVLDIELKDSGSGNISVDKTVLTNIFLERIKLNTDKNILLWEALIKNTFGPGAPFAKKKPLYTSSRLSEYVDIAWLLIKELDIKFVFDSEGFRFTNRVAQQIEQLANPGDMEKLHTGEQSDPIPIFWYKAPADYPKSIKLGTETYDMHVNKNQSKTPVLDKGGSAVQIGVNEEHFIQAFKKPSDVIQDKLLLRKSTPRNESVVRKYRETLVSYGYKFKNAAHNLEDVDHVKDLGFNGVDGYENFWPLDKDINRIAFEEQWYRQYKVAYIEDATTKKVDIKSLGHLKGKYFAVKGFDHDHESPGGRWKMKK